MSDMEEEKIFDRFFVVSLPLLAGTDDKAEIIYSFPQDCPNDRIYHAVPVFCFPDCTTLRQQAGTHAKYVFELSPLVFLPPSCPCDLRLSSAAHC